MWTPDPDRTAPSGDRLEGRGDLPGGRGRPDDAFGRRERALAALLLAAAAALHGWHVFHWRVDADETQHLHIVWGWTQGLAQYRDVFANNMPLFHLLCAPALASIGETPDIVPFMRLWMVPLAVATLLGTYTIARRLFSARVGLWAVVFLAWFPPFSLVAVQFRTDVLWGAAATWSAATFVGGGIRPRRAFASGLFAGAAVAVSQRTVWLYAALVIALLELLLLIPGLRTRAALRRGFALGCAFAAGSLVVPLLLAAFLLSRGLFDDLVRWAFEFNAIADVDRSRASGLWWIAFALALAALGWGARAFLRRAPSPDLGLKRAAVLLVAGSFGAVFWTFSPTLHQGALLPMVPLFAAVLTRRVMVARPLPFLLAELALLVGMHHRYREDLRPEEQARLLRDVLAVTDRDDYVLDRKGETVFRRRPYFYAMVIITKERFRRGLLRDDVAERVVETGTCVATADLRGFPPAARAFLERNFVVCGPLRVAGRTLRDAATGSLAPIPFDVEIAARYVVVTEGGAARGSLDGVPLDGARELSRGPHVYAPAPGEGRLSLAWAQAIERGLSVRW